MKMPTHMEFYEEDNFANTLMEMIKIDSDLEKRKNALALKSDFNLHDVLALFDRDNKGHVQLREYEEVYNIY